MSNGNAIVVEAYHANHAPCLVCGKFEVISYEFTAGNEMPAVFVHRDGKRCKSLDRIVMRYN